MNNLEIGNCCYIKGNYKTLWLIVEINRTTVRLKDIKGNTQVIMIKDIIEIIEN